MRLTWRKLGFLVAALSWLGGCEGADDPDMGAASASGSGSSSAGDSDSGGGVGFSDYCTATLSTEVPLMESSGPGSWTLGDETASAGTAFLLATSGTGWEGYVLSGNEVIGKIANTTIELGTDFTTDCTADPLQAQTQRVVLLDASMYDTSALSGTPCMIPAGTVMAGSYSFSLVDDGVAEVSSAVLEESCGLDVGYTPDLVTADLVNAS